MNDKLKPCPLCGGKMEVKHQENQDHERGYYVTCTRCSLYFGLDREDEDMGYLQGGYCNDETVILEWNARNTEKVLPAPCTNINESSVKDWLQKINEELDEFKEAVLHTVTLTGAVTEGQPWRRIRIAEEAADTITAITSMLEAMGIDEEMRQEAQRQVNEKNKERGYW